MKLFWMIGLIGATVTAGCTHTQDAQVQQSVKGARQELQQGVDQAKKVAADKTLEAKVKQYLLSRKGLDARSINVEARAGAVTLKGDVASPEQAKMAEQAVGEVQG